MWQKEENWNIALRKAAHKNAMQHITYEATISQ